MNSPLAIAIATSIIVAAILAYFAGRSAGYVRARAFDDAIRGTTPAKEQPSYVRPAHLPPGCPDVNHARRTRYGIEPEEASGGRSRISVPAYSITINHAAGSPKDFAKFRDDFLKMLEGAAEESS